MPERVVKVLWPALAASLAAWMVASPIIDTDIWWHLTAAREMIQRGSWLAADPFSVSADGATWVNVHWLFQLLAYAAYTLGQESGLVLAKSLVCGVGAAIVVLATPSRARGVAGLGLAVTLFAVRFLVMVRPVVLTLLFLAAFFFLLERWRSGARWPVLLGLPVIQVLWANCQGLHILGPVLVACYLAGAWLEGRAWRPLVATLSACLVASLVNPDGWRGATLPFRLFARIDPDLANIYAVNVSEFVPPWHLERLAPGSTLHLTLFLLALAASFVLARRRLVWAHLALTVVLTTLALMANRNMLLLYWLGVPVLATNVMGHLDRTWNERWPVWARRGLRVGGAIAVIALVATGPAREGPLDAPAPFRLPLRSAELLAAAPLGGKIFCSVRYGGYLMWRLWPRWKPYIDGRLILRTRTQFAEYLDILDHPERFPALQARHDFAAVVLPIASPDRYLGLVTYLLADPDWHLADTDGSELLLVRQNGDQKAPPAVEQMRRAAERHYSSDHHLVARHNLARLLLAQARTVEVRRVLSGLGDETSQDLEARSYYLEGDLDRAEIMVSRRLALNQDDLNSLNLMAAIATDRGQTQAALAHLARVLDLDPYNAQGNALLRRLEQNAAP